MDVFLAIPHWGSLATLCGVLVHTVTVCHAVETPLTVRGRVNIVESEDFRSPDLSRVVVFLDEHPDLPPLAANQPTPQMVQENKAFHPNLLVVSRGTSVEFPNKDPFSHNVFSRSQAARFDLDRYPKGVSKSYRFNTVGLIQLFCNIHPQMRAVILVVPNRYFSRADSQGRFAIEDVPAGTYSLVYWHERTGALRETIEVNRESAGENAVSLTQRQPQRSNPTPHQRRPTGDERGLGVKRERLNLPVVRESHPDPQGRS